MSSEAASQTVPELTTELSAKLLRRVVREWRELNWSLFHSQMRPPVLEFIESTSDLGQWKPRDRTIALSRPALLTRPWTETLETLKHEMAHQFVDEILGGEAKPHGPVFRRVCEQRGIDAGARARRKEPTDEDQEEDRVIARVRKLLALAESSNQHEAELAASMAQRMMLKYNIELERGDDGDAGKYSFLWIGKPSGRVQVHQKKLAGLLLEHFFVQAIWVPVYRPLEGKPGSVLELCGRPENLQMAEFVHDFVSRTIERLWKEHKKQHEIRSDRDRRTFLSGAVSGFSAKLREKHEDARREGLVWAGDVGVVDYLGRRYPRVSTTSYSENRDRAAYGAGKSAGRTIVLSRPVSSSAESTGPRRALTPGARR